MSFICLNRPLMALLLIFSSVISVLASSVAMAYCASINTASTNANSSIYQSDGLCYNFCVNDWAYAVVQGQDCWCSNYTPDSSTTVDTSDCSTQCPGYPSDTCGGDNLYGYMALSKSAEGTKGASTATSTSQGTSTVDETTVTVTPTPTTTKSSTTADADSSTTSMSTYVSTVTQPGGSVILQTVTVIPTVTASSESNTSGGSASKDSKAISTGAAVGIAVGSFGFVAIIVAVGVWLWLRRKHRMQEEAGLDQRNSFRGSSAGMTSSTPRTEMASVWGEGESMGRRSSRLMPHDPRMDPFATNIYSRFDNKSRESVNTLRDDQDYSRRVLRTTNPDPDGAD